jgi:hypothetical protein
VQHATAHGNLDQRLTAAGQSLMIATEPTPPDDPGEGSLDHPSSGQGAKATREELFPINLFVLVDQQSPFGDCERFDRLDRPPQGELDPRAEGASVVAVSPNQLETGKHLFQWRKQRTPSLLIRFLSSRYLDFQQVALRINQRMAFPAPRFFSPCRSPFQDHERHWF